MEKDFNFKGILLDKEKKYHLYLSAIGDQKLAESVLVLNVDKLKEVIDFINDFIPGKEAFFVLKYKDYKEPARMFLKSRTKGLKQFYRVIYLHTYTMHSGAFYTRSRTRESHLVEARKLLIIKDKMFEEVPDGEIMTSIAQESNNWGYNIC